MSLAKKIRTVALAPTCLVVLSMSTVPVAIAQAPAAPDNSRTNKAHNQSLTADQQKENTSDRQLTAKIRRAVVSDKSLSIYAHNVKIIVTGGAVTLKGPVHSEDEKRTVAAKAAEVVGQDKVTNEITVKQ